MEKVNHRNGKPEYDRLSRSVQVLLKSNEFKNLERIRRELSYSSNAASVRMLLLKELDKKRQTELL